MPATNKIATTDATLTAIAKAAAAICIFRGSDLVYEFISDEYRRLVGNRDYIGRPVLQVVPEIDNQPIYEILMNVYLTGKPASGLEEPVQLWKSNDSFHLGYYNFHFEPLFDIDGSVNGVIQTATEVTDEVVRRQVAENTTSEIEHERQNFRNLFKQTPELICILSGPNHVYEFVNEAHVRALGFDATGMSVREAQPESVEVYGILDDVFRTGETATLHELPVTVTDRLRYFNVTYSARRNQSGVIDGIMILGVEVTDQVTARTQLIESEARFRQQAEQLAAAKAALEEKSALLETVFDHMPSAVVIANASGKLIYSNPQLKKVWRHDFIPADEIDGYRAYIAFHPDGRRYEGRDWPLARAISTGEVILNEETDVLLGDKTRAILSISAAPVRNQNGEIIAGVVLSEDMTARAQAGKALREAKEAAEAANLMKSAFIANVSHEIRTPLGAILGFTELLKDSEISGEEHRDYLEVITRNGQLLTTIIDDVLDLSKIEAGQLKAEILKTPVRKTVEDVVDLISTRSSDKNQTLTVDFDEAVPTEIGTDPTRFKQILTNIVGNAVKFTPVDGSINVGVKYRRNAKCYYLVVDVEDNGIGISADQQQRLFLPFSQADESTTRRFGGTGLGLSLSRHLAVLLGGDVSLVRSHPGEGSTFRVEIEDQSARARDAIQSPANLQMDDLSGIRILIVEDAPDIQQLVARVLTRQHASVSFANNGEEGCLKALEEDFDVVLMDVQMPVLDGYSATEKLRKCGYNVPIIALTAHAMSNSRQKSIEVGCNDCLTKPFNFRTLVSKVYQHARLNHR